jgi:ribonucleoside-diphosphate reductase alpha chain
MSECNELSKQILESKYYAEDEATPEHLFSRVAKIVAIPDVIDKVAITARADKVSFVPADFAEQFSPHELVCNRVLTRRGIKIDPNRGADWAHIGAAQEDIKDIWREETKKYYDIMANLEFMPGTPTLINAGRASGMLSSCFFLRVPDSMEGIMETNKQLAMISKAGGGVGLDVSTLRPRGAPVTTSAKGTSSGPVSFLKVFNETGNQVQQGGVRRAALIAIMSIDHPDIVEFIRCKEEEGVLSNFNISVLITDEFMKAVKDEPENLWGCNWKGTSYIINKETSIPEVYDGKQLVEVEEYYRVKDIWNLIVEKAWRNGEPGVIFWDELNRGDIFNGKFGKLGVNPCGEQPLLPFESCNLAAINLGKCWYYSEKDERNRIDYDKIKKLTELGIRFLDNVIDINNFPLPEIEEWTLKTRRIGLGTMGLHDLMLRKEIRYGSEESLALIDNVYSIISQTAQSTSTTLGTIRGVPADLKEFNRRNSGLLTVQPTGTVSIICNQTSSGVEPVFQWEFTRKDSYGTHEMQHFMREDFPDDMPDYAVTALEVPPEEHVRIQAQIQKYIDSSISKTVNLPNNATREQVNNIFRLAYKTKCKSITIYRSGSRQTEVLIKEKEITEEPIEESSSKQQKPIIPRFRGPVLFGATFKINTPGGKAYITINEDDSGLREVFVHISKAGSEITTHVEAEGRLISHSLKHGIPATTIIGHLAGHKSNPIFDSGRSVKSVPDAVALVMREYLDRYEGFSEFIDKEPAKSPERATQLSGEISGELCPDCGEVMYHASGCNHCYCGFSQCG